MLTESEWVNSRSSIRNGQIRRFVVRRLTPDEYDFRFPNKWAGAPLLNRIVITLS